MNNRIVCEFASETSITGNTVSGYAHVFGQKAFVKGQYESFSVGAFDEALKTSDARAFLEHQRHLILGRQSSGTLKVYSDSTGLGYELELGKQSYAQDLMESLDRGDIKEMSFGFIPNKFDTGKAKDGLAIRNHTQARELVDISPVALPAFAGTSISLRDGFEEEENARSQLIKARAKLLRQ